MKNLITLFALSLALTSCGTPARTPTPTPNTTPTTTEPASPSMEEPTPVTPSSGEISDTASYHNATYGVSFEYPKTWSFREEKNYFVSLKVPESLYEGTNFEQASFSVAAEPTASLDACLALSANGAMEDFDKEAPLPFNNHTYYTAQGGDSGMGHWGSLIFYRTYQNQNCFTFLESIVITNPAPEYHPTPFTEVDTDEVRARLDAIMQTVGFDSEQ